MYGLNRSKATIGNRLLLTPDGQMINEHRETKGEGSTVDLSKVEGKDELYHRHHKHGHQRTCISSDTTFPRARDCV